VEYCQAQGHETVIFPRGHLAPPAAVDNWAFASGDTSLPISFEQACKWEYGLEAVQAQFADLNDAFSWYCYRRRDGIADKSDAGSVRFERPQHWLTKLVDLLVKGGVPVSVGARSRDRPRGLGRATGRSRGGWPHAYRRPPSTPAPPVREHGGLTQASPYVADVLVVPAKDRARGDVSPLAQRCALTPQKGQAAT
jgi:hypothetical protein